MPASPLRRWIRAVLLSSVVATLIACGSGAGGGHATPPSAPVTTSGAGSTGGAASEPSLADAFAVAPKTTMQLLFQDWAARKRAFGVRGPSSAMTTAARAAFVKQLFDAGLGEGPEMGSLQPEQFDTWGFDAIDLAWEAEAWPADGGSPVVVLAFDRGGFDVTSLPARFESCGYDRTSFGDQVVYSTDTDNRCLSATFGPILPTGATRAAIVPDRNLLLLSYSTDNISAELDVLASDRPTLADDPKANLVTDALGSGDTAIVRFGTRTCSLMKQSSLLDPTVASLERLDRVQAEFGGHPYIAVGSSEQLAPKPGSGTILFVYPSDAEAQADLTVRSKADAAPSFVAKKAYGEFAFHVDDAKADGQSVRLDVSEPQGATSYPFALLFTGDATFALCRE